MHFQGLSHNDIKKSKYYYFLNVAKVEKCGKSAKMWQKVAKYVKKCKMW